SRFPPELAPARGTPRFPPATYTNRAVHRACAHAPGQPIPGGSEAGPIGHDSDRSAERPLRTALPAPWHAMPEFPSARLTHEPRVLAAQALPKCDRAEGLPRTAPAASS